MKGKGKPIRRRAKPAKAKVKAKLPAGRNPRKGVASSRAQLEKRLAESLEQQAATSEILRVMSGSLTHLQPVLDAIAERAARLCDAWNATVLLRDGEALRMEAHHGSLSEQIGIELPIDRRSVSGRAFIEGHPIHVDDLSEAADFPLGRPIAAHFGIRSFLAVPLVREAVPIGVITIQRTEIRPFSDTQIELLKTFADQAVIAIENVRLFTELETRNAEVTEALEQQTATAEILRVISSSPTDLQPVFDTIAEHAMRLCSALHGVVLRFDGELIHLAALANASPEGGDALRRAFPTPPGRHTSASRAILTGAMIHIPDVQVDPEYALSGVARTAGYRSIVSVPMLRDGQAIGTINVHGAETGQFSERQIQLLKTFADQALIAIENVRLFTELGARNRELTVALDQQTATSEILRVISSSQTDVQPVFGAIAESAARLTGAAVASVYEFDGSLIHLRVIEPVGWLHANDFQRDFPRPPAPDFAAGRVILERAILHHADLWNDPDTPELTREWARRMDLRSVLWVPMVRDGEPIGVIGALRREAGFFSDEQVRLLKTFADQAVIAIENVRLFKELEARNSDLTETLEQQTATSEILGVISRSPTDVQPTFDAIAASATRLCDAVNGLVILFDGRLQHLAAHHNVSAERLDALGRTYPRPPSREGLSGRAILTRSVVQVADVLEDPEYTLPVATTVGYRSALAVPMLREGMPIGTILVARDKVAPFSDKQIALLQTFADQAVIAIENVRLFTELGARNRDLTVALDQQTATSEILRVISSSQTDVQPVFDAIVRSAVRLCGADHSYAARFDGELLHPLAFHGFSPEALEIANSRFPIPPSSGTALSRAALIRAVVNVPDMLADPEYSREYTTAGGWRGVLAVPMLRDGNLIGSIAVGRTEPGVFPGQHVELLKTFADQAVIAIENVRLFKELEARNADLTEALEQQTATAEVLRVISSSPTDVQPVFDIIGERAERLCDADVSVVSSFDGELIELVALHGVAQEGAEAVRRAFPMRLDDETVTARAVRNCAVVHVSDVLSDPSYQAKDAARAGNYRGCLGVPMVREGQVIGVIFVARASPGYFADTQVALLQTFADQAVIAIENVRLFRELEARTAELTRSVSELKALGEISQAVSSTLDVETVLNTIVSRASQLAGADGCSIYEYDEATQTFHVRATHNYGPALVETLRATPLRKGEGAMGRATETGEPIQIADIAVPGAYHSHLRDVLIGAGFRALLSVPLLREDQIIGSLSLNRSAPGEFPPEVIEVLKTFATQSALAIQNARLFREIADKSRQLEVASRHKSEFLANMSHELRTPLNAIIGFSEVLTERMFGELNEKQDEYLKDIHTSGTHLLSLINDILDLSKIEAGRMELELTDFHLPTAIDNALTLVRERAGRKGIRLEAAVDERVGEVRGDERKIRQVVLNLLSNAIKFTPEGGRIEVGAARVDGFVEVSVSDSGVGIAPEDQEAVFEEFRQVGASAAKQEGTGLGLALCRKFVELHGGSIRVTSEVGVGSTFTFTIPVRGGE